MANHALKHVFHDMQAKTVDSISPDSLMVVLLSKKVIGEYDYSRLCQVSASGDRCRALLSLLHLSSHPQTFVLLRLALLDEYSSFVDEIDDSLTSPIFQRQQIHCCADQGQYK